MNATIKKVALTGILLMAVVVAASAYGGGGFFQGTQIAIPGYTNMDVAADVQGGYGYGVSRSGRRHGGFGNAPTQAGQG